MKHDHVFQYHIQARKSFFKPIKGTKAMSETTYGRKVDPEHPW